MPQNTGRTDKTATDTRFDTHKLAMIIHGHTWLAMLHDETAPIWVSTADARPAWQVDHLDARCAECDSRTAVQHDERVHPEAGLFGGVFITTGHAARCRWLMDWLDRAGVHDDSGLGVVGAALTGAAA